jgi:cobalamin-dependent methionine synthase I
MFMSALKVTNICQHFAAGQWFSPGTLVSSTIKTDLHDIAEILLKVVLSTLTAPSIYI